MNFLLPIRLVLIFSISLGINIVYAEESLFQVFNDVESEVSLRQWNSKGSGNLVAKEKITVIKTKDDHGDVVVIKNNRKKANFETEIYKSVEIDDLTSVWKLVNKTKSKTLTHQHGQFYMIQERVSGKDGGVLSQVFKLPKSN